MILVVSISGCISGMLGRVVISSLVRSASRGGIEMIGSLIVDSTLLVGQAAALAHSWNKQETTSKAAAEVDPRNAMSEYDVLKEVH